MELFLIRHGETVDNVAGLYAGVRDSALTNHGVEQARRLGKHFAEHVSIDRIFASPLSRAYKTAQALQAAQTTVKTNVPDQAGESTRNIEIVCVPELIEQDFGSFEGKSFQSRTDSKKSGKEAHPETPVESKDSLNKRADIFLDNHLIPLLRKGQDSRRGAIAVVSHGILLSHLWRRLLLRLPPKSVTVADIITSKGSIVLQHLGGWSNTGYLHLLLSSEDGGATIERKLSPLPTASTKSTSDDAGTDKGDMTPGDKGEVVDQVVVAAIPEMLVGWSTLIVGIDRKDHLIGLKRQRGGIGRAAHDEGQQKLTGFFKRHRAS